MDFVIEGLMARIRKFDEGKFKGSWLARKEERESIRKHIESVDFYICTMYAGDELEDYLTKEELELVNKYARY